MIYTFYSYKGGVGRTMALANIAELFYQAGLTVLMVDWDLEAPGLERFFPTLLQGNILQKRGIIDMLLQYKVQMSQELPDSEEDPISLLESPKELIVDVYPDSSQAKLWFLPSGKRSDGHSEEHFTNYANSVLTFDWQDFYENWEGERYFDWLREQFEDIADVILIDSRTGVTEMGGVCTYQFADIIVMLCATNQQNLEGIYKMALSFKRPELTPLRRGRPLEVLIVPARVDFSEGIPLNQFKRDFLKQFEEFVPAVLGDSPERLWELEIPYVPYYAYNERVAVRERGEAIAGPIVNAFDQLAQTIEKLKPTRLVFVNREEELKRILSYFAPAYHLIDAPAGYGKTALLQELKHRFEEQQWVTAYVAVGKNHTLPNITQALAAKLNVSFTKYDNTQFLGQNLAQAVLQQRGKEFSSQNKKGLVLLIDIDTKSDPLLQPTVKELFTNFIPTMQQSLHGLNFFQEGHNRFRVIFAGRYLAGKIPSEAPFRFAILKLTSFNYEIVREAVQAYLPYQKEIEQLAAHLMYYTTGHPSSITRVLRFYEERGNNSPDEFFCDFADEIWENIVWPESDAIRQDIEQRLRRIFDGLSFFRFLNYSVLDELRNNAPFPEYADAKQFDDAFDLADALTGTYLMDWENRLLRDALTRRLLVLRFLRELSPQAFAKRCQHAQSIYATQLQNPATQMPERWTIECLFQFLQQYTKDIQLQQKRKKIGQNFLANVVPNALHLLVKNRNPQVEYATLKQTLAADWEFRFTVNYYLRENQYNDEPYRQLEQEINDFFTQIQEVGGNRV